ncbi:unnamed protein product [Toxocara canis]|uniref:MADF domain-containing protein n=1 Tax=Toxocara canis TaxID=6265 RepID=A0A183U3W1_TOXCA|nr:unnamed protein product [Toxocara canis]
MEDVENDSRRRQDDERLVLESIYGDDVRNACSKKAWKCLSTMEDVENDSRRRQDDERLVLESIYGDDVRNACSKKAWKVRRAVVFYLTRSSFS